MNQKPSEWGNRKINLIIFFAMTNDSWADYKTFYQTLIKLFENHSNMKAIQESKNYVEFNQAIKQLIKR